MPTTVATHNSTLASRGGFRSERPRYAAGCGLARPILSPSGNCGRWANLECVARRRGRARDPRLKSKSLIGPAEKETAVEGGPAADHRRLARRPVLNDPIQLIGPASLVGNSRETFHKSGTYGSYPVSSSGESAKFWFLGGGAPLTLQVCPHLCAIERFDFRMPVVLSPVLLLSHSSGIVDEKMTQR